MYSDRKAASVLVVMANTTSLPMWGFRASRSSKLFLTLRTRTSASGSSSGFAILTGAGRTVASRKLPSSSISESLARYLPSTRMRTRSSDTRITCLTSATTP